jgi:hypothetical protein
VREQNLIRQDPRSLIPDLEDFVENRTRYYSKRAIMLDAIGEKDFEETVSIFYSK